MSQNLFKDNRRDVNISDKLLKFYKEHAFCDITLKTIDNNEPMEILAHKVVLAVFSKYLHDETIKYPLEKEIKINEIQGSILKPIIEFMYTGLIEFNVNNMAEILRAAVFLQMESLVEGCGEFVMKNLNSENCWSTFKMAKELKQITLQKKCLHFIYINFEDLTSRSEFLPLDEADLIQFLSTNTNDQSNEILNVNKIHNSLFNCRKSYYLQYLKIICNHFGDCSSEKLLNMNEKPDSDNNERVTKQISLTTEPVETLEKIPEIGAIYFNKDYEIEFVSYDPILNSWVLKQKGQRFPVSKNISDCWIFHENKLFVAGGEEYGTRLKSVECYNLQTLKWTNLQPLDYVCSSVNFTVLNEHICIVRHEHIEIYNILINKWKRFNFTHTYDKIIGHNNKLYFLNFKCGIIKTYDVKTEIVTIETMPIWNDRGSFFVVGVDIFLYIFSFYNNFLKIVRYNISDDSWHQFENIRTDIRIMNVTAIKNKFFFKTNKTIYEYVPETNSFEIFCRTSLNENFQLINLDNVCLRKKDHAIEIL